MMLERGTYGAGVPVWSGWIRFGPFLLFMRRDGGLPFAVLYDGP